MNPPFHIPFAVKIGEHEQVLSLKQPEESVTFKVKEKPVPSLLRGFSAPVILDYPYTDAELLHLMAHDDDAFNAHADGDAPIDDKATAQEVNGLLSTLPDRQRQMIEMVHLREMSLSDAASKSRLSVGAVKSLLHRAFTRLRQNGADDHG